MRALVVCGRGPDWNDRKLYEACRDLIGPTRIVRACDLSAYVGPDGLKFWHGGSELAVPDICFIRSFGPGNYDQLVARKAILRAFEASGCLNVNPVSVLEAVRDKFSVLMALRRAGFSVPATYLTESSYTAYSFCRRMGQFVFKPLTGSLGLGSILFDDPDLAFNAFRFLESQGCPLHVQEFVRNVERELRTFLVGREVIACVEKVLPAGKGLWKRNVALGAKMRKVRVPDELEDLCIRTVGELRLIYAAIDVLETEGDFIALEVNGAPNWKGLQEATGMDIARILVRKVRETLRM